MKKTGLNQILIHAATLHPKRPAVRFRSEHWSYEELLKRSASIACHLKKCRNAAQKAKVALWAQRNAQSVAAIHGILMSGACYVPIDPSTPQRRVAEILEDCGPSVIVGSAKERPRLSSYGIPYIALEEIRPVPLKSALRDLNAKISAQDLAYILYTSGSTGKPKAIPFTHRNAMSFIDWAVKNFNVSNQDRIANLAPFQFDLSIFDLFCSAKAAAELCIIPYPESAFPAYTGKFLRQNRITLFYTVPSALSGLQGRFPHLRRLLFAGEIMPLSTLRQWMKNAPRAVFFNLFGPTETNVCLYYRIPNPLPPQPAGLPIGKPIPGIKIRVEGPDKKGELLVSGPSVMEGYLNSSNRRSFGPGSYYRTGDIVSRGEDGNYYFWGRRDGQIKIRGYRVETGEVEACLSAHPGVEAAAVLPVVSEEKTALQAFFSPVLGKTAPRVEELRRFLQERLPLYMIPFTFQRLDKMPRLTNGKIDRTTLAGFGTSMDKCGTDGKVIPGQVRSV